MYSKHKDEIPEKTVERIKGLYSEKLGLSLDCRIDKHVEGIYSAYLLDKEGKWNTAGKGTTEAYCMASAYGESMEHICNHFAFDISKQSANVKEACGFARYADEQLLPIRTIVKECPSVWKDMTIGYNYLEEKQTAEDDVIAIWERLFNSDKTPFVPYYCINSDSTVLLPDAVISKLCGSNGGGSGNTPEEAIGHALDEIIERYVKYRILYEELTPPTIEPEYIRKRCPELYELIDSIERSGQFRIIVKDASLGEGYSVVCILVVDNTDQRYLANFGAHPCFEIALERCLTELFQDHECVGSLLNRNEMVKWIDASQEEIRGLKNWVSILRDDIGYLPDSIFLDKASWKFEAWPEYSDYTNHFGMMLQLEILRRNGFEVYIRNNSFLGFPVYRVYVPGVSVSHLNYDNGLIESDGIADRFWELLSADTPIIEKTALYNAIVSDNGFLLERYMHNWAEEDVALLKAALSCDIGDYNKAKAIVRDFNDGPCYFLRRYLELTGRGCSKERTRELLSLFFADGKEDVEKIERGDALSLLVKQLTEKKLFPRRNTASDKSQYARDLLLERIKQVISGWKVEQAETKKLLWM